MLLALHSGRGWSIQRALDTGLLAIYLIRLHSLIHDRPAANGAKSRIARARAANSFTGKAPPRRPSRERSNAQAQATVPAPA